MDHISSDLKEKQNTEIAGSRTNPLRFSPSGIIKRVFDFFAALIGLILLSPFFVFISILIKCDSPGPVFYWGPRIGRYGMVFKMLKFRTMYETPKSYSGPRVTAKDDDRITLFGKWLRETKLNELPQLWNVLIGEMSLVGPRPEDPSIAKTWPRTIAQELLSVRPGITSPASILYRDEENMLHAGEIMQKYLHKLSPDKMRLDQLYIRYRSFWLDLDVILWTFLLLMPKIKAYSPPEPLLFMGPITRFINRYLNWVVLDFLIVLASIGVSGLVVRLFGPLNIGLSRASEIALGCAVLYSVVGVFLNTNRINWSKASGWESVRLLASWLITTIAILGYQNYSGLTNLRTYGVILVASILSLFGIILVRYWGRLASGLSSHLLTPHPRVHTIRERVLIVGSGRTAEHISWLMDHPTYSRKFQIVGFIDENLQLQGMKIYGSKVIGRFENIQKIIKERDIGLIILADNQMAANKYREFRNLSSFSPARVVVAPDIFGSLSGLNGGAAKYGVIDNLNNFQCQHCLARYMPYQADDFNEIPLMTVKEEKE